MQLAPRVGDLEWNRNHMKSAIRQVGLLETHVVLMPELVSETPECICPTICSIASWE